MFVYEKKLQYPVRIANPNPKLAAVIISQYGGPYSNKLQYQIQWCGTAFLRFSRSSFPSVPSVIVFFRLFDKLKVPDH